MLTEVGLGLSGIPGKLDNRVGVIFLKCRLVGIKISKDRQFSTLLASEAC